MRVPSWGEARNFLAIEGWQAETTEVSGHKGSGHAHFRKVLAGNRVLRTHVSRADDKQPSRTQWAAILRDQLELTADVFWEALRTGTPPERPAPVEPEPAPQPPAWVWPHLLRAGYSAQEIAAMAPDEAVGRVRESWARSGD